MIEWWTAQQGNMIGAVGGAAVGVLGGGLGTLIGVCAPRGVLKTPVIATHALVILVGAAALAAGVVAHLTGQPRHVYYPLMLGGSITVGVLAGLFPMTLWAYRMAAARKQAGPGSPADVRGPSPAIVHAIVECWGEGGALRSLSLRVAGVMAIIAVGSSVAAVAFALRGERFGSWSVWGLVAFGPAIAAVLCWMLPRTLLATANNARTVLDQQRLAAEELRRG